MTSRLRAAVSALALALLVPTVAVAEQERNPFAELFGREPERTGREFTTVTFKSMALAQSAATLEGEEDQQGADGLRDGISASADAALSFVHIRDRYQIRSHGRGAYQEYRRPPAFGAPSYDAGVQLMVQPLARITFDAGGRYIRSPFFSMIRLAPFDAFEPATAPDAFAAVLADNDLYEASAGVLAEYARRSSLSGSVRVREIRFANDANDFSSRGASARWRRQMTRDIGFHAGFGREEIMQRRSADDRVVNDVLDVGIDFARAISFSRRTFLTFNSETTMVRENDGPRRFRLNGAIELERHFQRSWRASLGARRTTDFVPGFARPLLSDNGHASLGGYLAKRLIMNLNASGGAGQIGFEDTRKFWTYGADAKLTVALNRHLGVFGHYLYYQYELPGGVDSTLALPRLARHAVSVGLQTWVPLMNREKVTRDPR